jgi:hypothetical protein
MDDVKPLAAPTSLALAGAHEIVLTPGPGGDELKIWSTQTGQALLTVSVGAEGVCVRVSGASVIIEAAELLKLEAKKLVLSALQELVVASGGAAAVTIAGDLSVVAAAQHLVATEGEVRVDANDDIRLEGERVMMNCE